MEELFDIEYWLPFNGGEYHCTIAAGVNQAYVDAANAEYEKSLAAWRVAPSAWSLPFHHSIKIIPHEPFSKNKSYVKSEEHNKNIKAAEKRGEEEGQKRLARQAVQFMTNQQQIKDFKTIFKQYFKD